MYLDEILRLDGRAEFRHATICPDCITHSAASPGSAELRCVECLTPDLTCIPCCIRRHRMQPLHRVEVLYFAFSPLIPLTVILEMDWDPFHPDNVERTVP